MTKVIDFTSKVNANYNEETSDFTDILLQRKEEVAHETTDVLTKLPWIKVLKLTKANKESIINNMITNNLHHTSLVDIENKVTKEAGSNLTVVDNKLSDEDMDKELKFALNANEYNIRKQEKAKEYAKAA